MIAAWKERALEAEKERNMAQEALAVAQVGEERVRCELNAIRGLLNKAVVCEIERSDVVNFAAVRFPLPLSIPLTFHTTLLDIVNSCKPKA